MKKADLHIHTTASDGMLSPSEVVDWAVKKNLWAIAITDHDSILGIKEAIERSKEYDNILVIPGIELSSDYYEEEIHILGYFIDYNNEELVNATRDLRESRLTRGKKMVEKLKETGIEISFEEVFELTDEVYIGRPHIARVLINKGYANSISDAFDKYLAVGKAAYAKRYKLSLRDSIDLIHRAGGVAILAHPGIIEKGLIIEKVIDMGIDGIEIFHSKHDGGTINKFREMSNEHNLVCTGGSDCHGHFVEDELLIGKYVVDYTVVEELRELSKQKYQG